MTGISSGIAKTPTSRLERLRSYTLRLRVHSAPGLRDWVATPERQTEESLQRGDLQSDVVPVIGIERRVDVLVDSVV
jgi:hypothetical protein